MTIRRQELAAVVPAAGSGERLATGESKLLLPLNGKPILVHALRALELSPLIGEITVVVRSGDDSVAGLLDKWGMRKARVLPVGGKQRRESVQNGLLHVNPRYEFVVIHDGARPFLSAELLERCIREGVASNAAIAALPVTDTIKLADDSRLVAETLDRSRLWAVQTPQVFRRELILEAHRRAEQGKESLDDASLVERLGLPVRLVLGDPLNIKVTRQADLLFAEAIASQRLDELEAGGAAQKRRHRPSSHPPDSVPVAPEVRTGFGYDVHPLARGRPLVLGGVRIRYALGLSGHSDGDALAHAVCDALLGAASLGDIGEHFPDDDERYRGISSLILLETVSKKLAEEGYRIGNIDVTVVAERPKLAPYRDRMEARVARAAGLPSGCVNVKATTTERLGFVGREEGIACYATALLYETPRLGTRRRT